jgi:hypothetical protein
MDLPPCPVCGGDLELDSQRGPARCAACGFVTVVELDAASLGNLLQEAGDRGLGRRPLLAMGREAPEPRLEPWPSPALLEDRGVPVVPHLRAPTPPLELVAHAPPALEDPRTTVRMPGRDDPVTPLDDGLRGRDDARRKELRARGEIFR